MKYFNKQLTYQYNSQILEEYKSTLIFTYSVKEYQNNYV